MRGATTVPLIMQAAATLISIHTPHAGSDEYNNNYDPTTVEFQSTLPMRGATPRYMSTSTKPLISIHTPHAGSDFSFSRLYLTSRISIHTPHAGSDIIKLYLVFNYLRFQSTLPMRGATGSSGRCKGLSVFQSTLPMRGATQICCPLWTDFPISIHTPHAGSDDSLLVLSTVALLFQSTLPMRGATGGRWACGTAGVISIHTPHAGSDSDALTIYLSLPISIHTPHAGSDGVLSMLPAALWYFNPHSPCGERQYPFSACAAHAHFNPHSPCGERPLSIKSSLMTTGISIHTPHAGSD